MSNEEICSTYCLLRTGTLTNTVYEVNNSTAALSEQLLTRAIYSGIKVTFIPKTEYPDREHPAIFLADSPPHCISRSLEECINSRYVV